MTLSELREKHPRFVYQSFKIEPRKGELRVRFRFLLEPDIVFTPEVVLPLNSSLNQRELENLVFHLGLIEMISYWKVACPQEIQIETGRLTEDQVGWWHDLFIHGLGEFFYQNQIDFTAPDFLKISSDSSREPYIPTQQSGASGDLILVGGGKDSTVTLELLKELPGRKGCLILNPIKAPLRSARIAGYAQPLVVKRAIHPKLLELNRLGYLNGHTPFSAYLAFLGVLVARLHGYEKVIVSNDRSADEGSVIFHGLGINHQYSKSFRFEKLFREYCAQYLSTTIQYFSFLRPLYEIQISRLFANYPQHFSSFRSCNVGQKTDSWCGTCAKCAFVYISLSPFLPLERMKEIFGEDYYFRPEIAAWVRRLTGLEEGKPFDCVGTREESILAVALAIRQYRAVGEALPPVLVALEKELSLSTRKIGTLEKKIGSGWRSRNFLPRQYATLLKNCISKI